VIVPEKSPVSFPRDVNELLQDPLWSNTGIKTCASLPVVVWLTD